MKTITELLEEAKTKAASEREQFIQARTQQENDVNAFLIRLRRLPPVYMEKFPLIKEDTTFQTLFPSLYAQHIDVDAYNKEFDAFSEFIKSVQEFEDTVNKKARETLLAYLND